MSWLISILGISAKIMTAHRIRANWVVSFVCNGLFSWLAVEKELYGLLPLSAFQAVLCIYGWRKWGKEDELSTCTVEEFEQMSRELAWRCHRILVLEDQLRRKRR